MCDKFTIVLIEELLISGKLDGKVTKILVWQQVNSVN